MAPKQGSIRGVGIRRLLAVLVAAAVLGACAPAEYTTTQARDDLVRHGWSSSQAQCFLDGLHKYYAGRYVAANQREDARRNIKFSGVSPQGSDLYVRNELSNSGSLSAAEITATTALARRCRA